MRIGDCLTTLFLAFLASFADKKVHAWGSAERSRSQTFH